MITEKDHAEARALLSAAAMWEERLDINLDVESPDPSGQSDSKSPQKHKGQEQMDNTDRTESDQNGLKKVLNMEWDDVEKKKFDAAYASAETLVNSLRNTTDMNERATLVANHVANKGKLNVPEAKLVMTMSKQKLAQDEHLAHLKEVHVSSESESGSDEESDSDEESSDESDVEEYKARERQNRISAAAATDKAELLESQQVKLAQRVRDLEILLYQTEQRAVIAEGTISDIEQKYSIVQAEDKRKTAVLKNVKQELDSKKQKIAVLESRIGGVPMPDIIDSSKKTSYVPPSGSILDENEQLGGGRSFLKKSNDKSKGVVENSQNEVKRGFWGNLLRVNPPEPIRSLPSEQITPQPEAKPMPQQSKKTHNAKVIETAEAVIVRQEAEFPGSSAGVLLNPGSEFEFTSTQVKKVEIMVSLAPPNTSSSSMIGTETATSTQVAKVISITFYQLSDGRGWVPDFNKNDPKTPLIEIMPISSTTNVSTTSLAGVTAGGGSVMNSKVQTPEKSTKLSNTAELTNLVKSAGSSSKLTVPSSPRSASPRPVDKSRGRVSAAAVLQKKKKKEPKESAPPPPPPGPQVLDIRFEECGDESLGLVLCPTRYGLEVVHTQGIAASKGVPLGSLIDYVGEVKLANRAQLKQNSLTYLKETLTNHIDDHEEGVINKDKEDHEWTEEDALNVSEKTFLELVAKVLPRPVHVGFVIPSEHKAFLEQKMKLLEKELKKANEQIRSLRSSQQQQQNSYSSLSGVGNTSTSSGSGRLTLKQRQEILRKKQEEQKALRLGAMNNKLGSNQNKKQETDPLPDYLKHCSASQKKQYLNLINSEREWKNKCEDLGFKLEDIEARNKLVEEDAAESSQLLSQAQRDNQGKSLEVKSLQSQIEALRQGAAINDKSHGIMKIKDERLKWFEGEIAHLRQELLHLTNVKGDNSQLKEWLETERIAHKKQLDVLKKTSSELVKENKLHLAKIMKVENALKTKNNELKQSFQMLEQSKKLAVKKQRDTTSLMVGEILHTMIDHVFYACENITLNTVVTKQKKGKLYLKVKHHLIEQNETMNKKRSSSFMERSISFISSSSNQESSSSSSTTTSQIGKKDSIIVKRKAAAAARVNNNKTVNINQKVVETDLDDFDDSQKYIQKKQTSKSIFSFGWLCGQSPANVSSDAPVRTSSEFITDMLSDESKEMDGPVSQDTLMMNLPASSSNLTAQPKGTPL